MTFRTRILLACLLVALVPLTVFVVGVRREVRSRLGKEFQERVEATGARIQNDLARQAATLDAQLRALAARSEDDPLQRAALLGRGERSLLLDYASAVMPAASLDYLLLIDSVGNVLSSGHFRNDFDHRVPALPTLLAAEGPVLVATRRPQADFLALVRAHAFTVGDQRFALAGGIEVDSAFLARLANDTTNTVVVALEYPGGALASDALGSGQESSAFREDLTLPFIDDAAESADAGQARWSITHSTAQLRTFQRGLDAWFLAAIAAAVVLAFLIARALAARLSQPLEELAGKSTRVNLDRLDVEFATERQDEIGSLSRMLDAMVKRMRSSAQQLRAAERRATVGDLARQVNHDLRNGLLPIRNVIRHLSEVAKDSPAELGTVFAEREGTLQGGISYLESLATNYARLSPRAERQACDVNAIIRTVVRESGVAEGASIRLDLSNASPRVAGDPVALRRIIENLAINAVESLANGNGSITLKSSVQGTGRNGRVTITVADTGSGIAPEALDHIFDDFYTTKERGTGLGLSIVRRLVADLGGRIRVESERGQGTAFHVELPGTS